MNMFNKLISYIKSSGNHNESLCMINSCGDKQWRRKNRDLHRVDGPAVISGTTGELSWYLDGIRYSEIRKFKRDGKLSDEDITLLKLKYGNILERNTTISTNFCGDVMYRDDDGDLHRIDGPAVTLSNGERWYYSRGVRYFTAKSYQDATCLSDDEMRNIIDRYGNIS